MDKEVKALWLEALRSGRYEQATGKLATVNEDGSKSYCCLGVLCDVAVKAGVDVGERVHEGYMDHYDDEEPFFVEGHIEFDYADAVLPVSVIEWAGLSDSEGQLNGNVTYNLIPGLGPEIAGSLTELNDGAEYNFRQIADVIEDQF